LGENIMPKIEALHKLLDLNGQVAIITGGSRGLGMQIAEALGEFGAEVVLIARKADELEKARAHLSELGIKVTTFAHDLSSAGAIAALTEKLKEQYKRIDILVNNAGTNWAEAAENHSSEAWNKLLQLNLTSMFELTKAIGRDWFIPQKRGRIINLASTSGLLGLHPKFLGTLGYSTTKAGVIGFTRALAAEWGPHGITVNALAPGFFPSKMTRGFLHDNESEILNQTPLARLGGPDDLKGIALLFGSSAGQHITGQVMAIDGGFTVI